MSRTVHHLAYTHRDGNCANHTCAHTRASLPSTPWHSLRPGAACDFPGPDHTRLDLRYSAAVLSASAANGTRPVPEPVTTTLPMNRHESRSWQNGAMGPSVRAQSRAERRATTPALRVLTGDLNAFLAGHGPDPAGDWTEVDAVVVGPARHRHNVRADYGW